jgi:excisionase family DNA binding protein
MLTSELLTPRELADFLHVKLSTIYYWSHIGYIPRVKAGKHLRFRRSSVEAWLAKREKRGRTSAASETLLL